jgi:hypothetical protein
MERSGAAGETARTAFMTANCCKWLPGVDQQIDQLANKRWIDRSFGKPFVRFQPADSYQFAGLLEWQVSPRSEIVVVHVSSLLVVIAVILKKQES